ncbi:Retrovirus-related Pol polyprotein from transposon TNT 1-94-like protein [Drosera capensis]
MKLSSICVVLRLVASLDLEIEQMDIKTACLHGDPQEEIYMEQSEGLVVKGKEDYVCRLRKNKWYKKFEFVMKQQGYRKTKDDHCVFLQRFSTDDFIIMLLYVDYMLIIGKNASRIVMLKK